MGTLMVYFALPFLAVLMGGLALLARSAPVNARAAGYASQRLAPILARSLGAASAPVVTVADPSRFINQLRIGRLDSVEIHLGRCVRPGFTADGVVVVATGISLRTAAVVRGQMDSLNLESLGIRFVGASSGGLTVSGGGSVTLNDVAGLGTEAAHAAHAEIQLSSVKVGNASIATAAATVTDIAGLGSALARAAHAEITLSSALSGKAYVDTTTATVTNITVPAPTRGTEAVQPPRSPAPSIACPTLGALTAQLSDGNIDGLDVSMEISMSDVLLEPVSRDDTSGNGPSAIDVTVDGRCDYGALNGFLKKRRVPVTVGPTGRGSPFLRLNLPSAILDGVDARVTAAGNVVAVEPVAPSNGLWMFVPAWLLRDQERSWTVRKVVRNLPSGLSLSSADTDRHSVRIRAHGSSVRLLSTAPPHLEPD
jgi:hypothetical protein